jgi:hypothetical protein
MKLTCRIAVAGALALASAVVDAESRLHTGVAMIADDDGGRSRDLDLAFAPNQSWSIEAGFGSVEGDSNIGTVEGTSVRAGVGVRSERFGLRGYYRNYSDSSNFESETLGARFSMSHASLTWSLIAEARGSDVEYTSSSAGRATQGTAHIDTKGYGLGVAYAARGWGLYAEGVLYDSQSQLESYDVTDYTPTLLGIPVAHQVGSSPVFKHGVLDHQLAIGIERGFRRSSLRFDWTAVEDAISGANSNTFSAGLRSALSANVQVGITLGVTNSSLDSAKFAGASLLWSL